MDLSYSLPERPQKGLLHWALENYGDDELGGQLMLFSRESIDVAEMEWGMMMHPSDIDKYEKSKRRRWGARCTCTACGSEFYAGYHQTGIRMLTGEDGLTYPGWCGPDSEEGVDYDERGYVICPDCDCQVMLVRASDFQKGFTKQLMVCSPERAGDHLALVYWMIYRELDPRTRYFYESVEPWEAVVISERGGLKHYAHRSFLMGGISAPTADWRETKAFYNPEQRVYHDYGSTSNRKAGAVVYKQAVDDIGTTGEKTGLMAYIMAGGEDPVAYLRLWKEWKAAENMVKDGWTAALDKLIAGSNEPGWVIKKRVADAMDVTEVKPHRILHMSKEEYRKADHGMSGGELQTWAQCWRIGKETCSFTQFAEAVEEMGYITAGRFVERTNQDTDHYRLTEVTRYVKRKCHNGLGGTFIAGQLLDYRRMMRDMGVDLTTEEELWPSDIIRAHDRAHNMALAAKMTACQEQFDKVRERLACLEWTDGDLCIRIPQSEGELVQEGKILRHCVGGYGKEHSKGEKVILFVRHYRRPERPYYTLNEDITQREPRRIQLHGYGNERHGDHKQHSHRIPDKVTDFVARWEREVLAPWLMERNGSVRRVKSA